MSILDYFEKKNVAGNTAMQIVRDRAREVGWKIKTDDGRIIIIGFRDDDGSVDDVYIRVCGEDRVGNTILEFSSSGIKIPDDMGAAALISLRLLERNAQILMGHWGIEDVSGSKFYTVFHSMIAETMDVEEFESAVRACFTEKSMFSNILAR